MPLFSQYMISIYTSLLMLFGNDHLPLTSQQTVLASFINLVGAIMLAIMFGELTVLVKELRQRSAKQQKKIDRAKSVMGKLNIKNAMENKIISFLKNSEDSLYFQKQLKKALNNVTAKLQSQITASLFRRICSRNPLIKLAVKYKNSQEFQQELSTIGAICQ